MKRRLILLAVSGAMLLLGFAAGAFLQNVKNGYHYRLLEEKEYSSALGPVKWSCFIESVGVPFLETEKTMISVGNLTVYKAQRDFQEANPHARNVGVSGNSIAWEDGDYRYHLTMEAMTNGEPNGVAKASQPIRSETNRTSSAAGSRR